MLLCPFHRRIRMKSVAASLRSSRLKSVAAPGCLWRVSTKTVSFESLPSCTTIQWMGQATGTPVTPPVRTMPVSVSINQLSPSPPTLRAVIGNPHGGGVALSGARRQASRAALPCRVKAPWQTRHAPHGINDLMHIETPLHASMRTRSTRRKGGPHHEGHHIPKNLR